MLMRPKVRYWDAGFRLPVRSLITLSQTRTHFKKNKKKQLSPSRAGAETAWDLMFHECCGLKFTAFLRATQVEGLLLSEFSTPPIIDLGSYSCVRFACPGGGRKKKKITRQVTNSRPVITNRTTFTWETFGKICVEKIGSCKNREK